MLNFLLQVFQTPPFYGTWRFLLDLLDIGIITFIFYRLFLLIRGTRALQMLIGLAILAAATVISQVVELHTTSWLLQNFWTIWVLAIIILFQPELRRALAQVGRSSLFNWFYPVEKTPVLDEVVKATLSLAAKKIGALIVFERDTPLEDFMEGGIAVDGEVSQELLTSIFLPYSPLHDGAVVISGKRIAWASCYLPLTLNPQLSNTLGTRHRAAVGLTEETDAIAIVVSEETGDISLAAQGTLTKHVEPLGLKIALTQLFESRREQNRYVHEFRH
ncbi:MAG: TIGR00159 family protein [Nitrospinae bacterium RIFCSPLOWO2_12_FULL_45_22]|nr:MAG: TIGR00159 family protein [Nitrospinae bacterium RIFCSPLOWO2_12_FULL_45_22]